MTLAALLLAFLGLPALAAGPNAFELRDPDTNEIFATIDENKNALFLASFTASAFFGDGYNLTRIMISSRTAVPTTSFTNTTFGVCTATVTMTTRGFGVRVAFNGVVDNSGPDKQMFSSFLVDGTAPAEFGENKAMAGCTASSGRHCSLSFLVSIGNLSAGQHSFCVQFRTSANTGTVYNDGNFYAQFSALEWPQ